ncbi:tetratricopeptide repeat protein, partial [Candidatus Poribacteria bacterium]|nr:tetratricopeptide repeat protein [Candidatus Poribacteria bacterium]
MMTQQISRIFRYFRLPKSSRLRKSGWLYTPIILSNCFLLLISCSPRSPIHQTQPLTKTGDAESAIAHYTQVMRSNPDSDAARTAHLKIGKVYYEQLGDHEKGIQIFEQIVQSYPTSFQAGEALWLLAKHDEEHGNYESARKRYLQFILDFSQDARSQTARLHLAACFFQLGRYNDALKTYADYEARYPTAPTIPAVLLKVGEIYAGPLNSPEKAREIYRRVLTEFPKATEEIAHAQQRLEAMGGVVTTQGEEAIPNSEDESTQLRQVGPKARPDARAELARWGVSPTFGYNPRNLLMEGGLLEGEEMQESLAGGGALLDDAIYNLGLMFYMSEDYKRAGTCLEKAAELGIRESNL